MVLFEHPTVLLDRSGIAGTIPDREKSASTLIKLLMSLQAPDVFNLPKPILLVNDFY
jgi:hypothetical protein